MEGDIALGMKYIGAGLACFGMIGAAIGVGNVAGNYLAGALRHQLPHSKLVTSLLVPRLLKHLVYSHLLLRCFCSSQPKIAT